MSRRLGRRGIAGKSSLGCPIPACRPPLPARSRLRASLAESDLTLTVSSAVRQPGILSTAALADQQPALPILPSRSTLSGACLFAQQHRIRVQTSDPRPPPVDEPCLKHGCRLPCRPLPRGAGWKPGQAKCRRAPRGLGGATTWFDLLQDGGSGPTATVCGGRMATAAPYRGGGCVRPVDGGLATVDAAWRGVAEERLSRVSIWAKHRDLVGCDALAATSVSCRGSRFGPEMVARCPAGMARRTGGRAVEGLSLGCRKQHFQTAASSKQVVVGRRRKRARVPANEQRQGSGGRAAPWKTVEDRSDSSECQLALRGIETALLQWPERRGLCEWKGRGSHAGS